jgi:addiction module RelE/StbE family toxin
MIQITYAPSFLRQLKKLPKNIQTEAKKKIALFENSPRNPILRMHKLHGYLKGRLSFSINSKYRVIFSWNSQTEVIFLFIGTHDIYT